MRKKSIIFTLLLATILTFTACSPMQTVRFFTKDNTEKVASEEAVGEKNYLDSTDSSLDDEQIRQLAFGAVLATRNKLKFDTMEVSRLESQIFTQVIERDWDIVDKTTALEMLDWLAIEGHHLSLDPDYYGFDEILNFLQEGPDAIREEDLDLDEELQAYVNTVTILMEEFGYTKEEIDAIDTVSAWDYDRLVTLARFTYVAGYINQEEAWEYIEHAVSQGVNDYDSWKSYFAGVMIGRAIWSGDDGFDAGNREIAQKLLMEEDSIYSISSFQ